MRVYLSRLILDPKNRTVRQCLTDCQAMHRVLLTGFPRPPAAMPARSRYDLLYRVEERPGSSIRAYVQSNSEPDWLRLPNSYLLPVTDNPATKCVDEQYGRLNGGTVLAFRLMASPTRKVGTTLKSERLSGQRLNGRRIFMKDEAGQVEWLQRKGVQFGFELLPSAAGRDGFDVLVTPMGRLFGCRPTAIASGESDGDELLVFARVLYEGRLRITDRDRFLQGLSHGIGSGKAYGLGLLSVAPAR
jgi:CRISPR system Cascade subunit CasE